MARLKNVCDFVKEMVAPALGLCARFVIEHLVKYPGGALNFFSGRGVWPRFLKCGACELIFASEKGGGLVN